MKILVTIIVFFGYQMSTKASDCCKNLLNIEFKTEVQPLGNGTLSLDFSVNDSLDGSPTIHIDSLWYFVVNNEELNINTNTLDTGNYSTGNEQIHSLTMNYDAVLTPFFLQELRMYVKVNGKTQMHIAYVYFTAWQTIEIFSESTLANQDRSWIAPLDGEIPIRTTIIPDTLPTYNDLDTTLPICWRQIDGLAYEVPVNCEDDNGGDELAGKNFFVKTFRGRAKGRVTYDYYNDENVWVVLPIANIRVEARSGFKNIGDGTTDDDGYFDFNFDRTVANTSGNIDVKIRVESQDNSNKVKVLNNLKIAYNLTTSRKNFNHQDGDRHDLNFGKVNAGHHRNFHIFHWARRAVDFAQSELSVFSAIPWGKLMIYVPDRPKTNGSCSFRHLPWPLDPIQGVIRLMSPNCLTSESTTYHEVGHYVHYAIQGYYWQTETGGTHTFLNNNKHPNQTITEGFADAFAFIIDARYHTDDDESFQYRTNPVHPLNKNADFKNRIFATTHPFTNEFLFAKSLLDLWDDVAKLEGFGAILDIDKKNDVNDNGSDEVKMQFAELCKPFYLNYVVEDVVQYYNRLLNDQPTTCDDRNKIKKMVDANFSFSNPSNYTGPGVLFKINTDAIKRDLNTYHRDDDLEDNGNSPQPYSYKYRFATQNEVDMPSLYTSNSSFNNAIGLGNNNLSDDLTIENGATLYFNNNIPIGYLIDLSTVRPPIPSVMTSDFCGISLLIEHQGTVIIGDGQVNCTAEVTATNNSTVTIMDGGTLIIRDNSKLIIDSDSWLNFQDGASIVLDGPNAVLEVKGKIEIGDNAIFTFTGEGYLKTDFNRCLNCDNIIAAVGSKIHLIGNGPNDKILEVADLSNFEPDATVTEFKLFNGKIEMGKDAILHVRDADPDFQNLIITAANPNEKFDQIMLNGNPQNTFKT